MSPEPDDQLTRRAALHAALGDPARLAIAEALVLGDRLPGELAGRLGISASLASHHIGVLEAAGVVARTRSEGDARRRYVTLRPGVLADVVLQPAPLTVRRVLFVCTANAARSQLAEAMWRATSPIPAASAGREPAAAVHPEAVRAAHRRGLVLSGAAPRGYDDVREQVDLVVSVCDRAGEAEVPAAPARLHWSVPDPVTSGSRDAFEGAAAQLHDRVQRLAAHVSAG